MRVHSQYQGGSGTPIQGIYFMEPGPTPYPATLDSYWDNTHPYGPLLLTDYDSSGIYVLSPDAIASYINGVDGPGQESQMDSNVGTAAGYEGFGVQIGIYPLDTGSLSSWPAPDALFGYGFDAGTFGLSGGGSYGVAGGE